MILLRDDPIISSMERTGYPPWMDDNAEEIIDADFEEIEEDILDEDEP